MFKKPSKKPIPSYVPPPSVKIKQINDKNIGVIIMIIWKLEIDIQGDDWERTEKYFFKTQDDAEAFKEEYDRVNTKADGSYIPTIRSIDYYFEENDFNNLKNEMTIADYESLFNTKLKPNNKLSVDDLKEGMIVWNETIGEYQRVRYIITNKIGEYHWCDGWGNIIEDDDLYYYKPN